MINLTNQIATYHPTPNCHHYNAYQVVDNDDSDPPVLIVKVNLYTSGGYKWTTSPYVLYIYDAIPSQVLAVNAAPTSQRDQFIMINAQLSGTAYTTLRTAFYAVQGDVAMRHAVEALLVTCGALPSSFAGTQQ